MICTKGMSTPQQLLKPHDLVVLTKIMLLDNEDCTLRSLGNDLGLSNSAVHGSLVRSKKAGFILTSGKVVRKSLYECMVFGVPYFCFPQKGEVVNGVPTADFAPFLKGRFSPSGKIPLVWPCEENKSCVEGQTLVPLHSSVPAAALRDERLYEILALVDVLRIAESADRRLAAELLQKLLS